MQRRNRTARSVWSAWSLLPLSDHHRLTTAPASWTHSKRFAWQFIHQNPCSLRAIPTIGLRIRPDPTFLLSTLPVSALSRAASLPLGVFALTAVFPPPTCQPDAFAISTGGSRHDPNARSGLVPAYSANISASRANKSACVAASNVPRTTLPASRGRFAILRNPGPMPPAGCSEWLPPRAEDWAWITPGERVACLWHERLGI